MRPYFVLFLIVLIIGSVSCIHKKEIIQPQDSRSSNLPNTTNKNNLVEGVDFFLPHIDLSNWKVTLPIGNPSEIKPPEILDYATNTMLAEFMRNDSTDGALVFYTYPGSTTANSSYSRTELREQMDPGSNTTNWTFVQGGRMKGTLSVPQISKNTRGNFHKTMVMQIHGRLTDEQRNLIGEDDNNAPPMLKILWQEGRILVKTKELKNITASDIEILHADAWTNDAGFYFDEEVGQDAFTLEIIVSEGRMEVILNDKQSKIYKGIHIERWSIFENYFKAGNYLQTIDKGASATVKYYDLEVSH